MGGDEGGGDVEEEDMTADQVPMDQDVDPGFVKGNS